MRRCSSHGELVGGYVLGALEPDEMEQMRQHAAGCPTCGPETRRMAALPGLLDTVKPGDVPPPAASPEVEEAILDRFARERQPAAVPRRRPRVGRRAVAAALAAVAVLALALLLLPFGDGPETTSYASARLAALDNGSSARATAYVNAVPAGTRGSLGARGLAGRAAVYESLRFGRTATGERRHVPLQRERRARAADGRGEASDATNRRDRALVLRLPKPHPVCAESDD